MYHKVQNQKLIFMLKKNNKHLLNNHKKYFLLKIFMCKKLSLKHNKLKMKKNWVLFWEII